MRNIWACHLQWGGTKKLASITSRSMYGENVKGGKKNYSLKPVEKS